MLENDRAPRREVRRAGAGASQPGRVGRGWRLEDSTHRDDLVVKSGDGDTSPSLMVQRRAAEVDSRPAYGLDFRQESADKLVELGSGGRSGDLRSPSLTTGGLPSAPPDPHPIVTALARLGNDSIGGAQVFGTWTFRDPPPRPGSPYFTSIGHGGGVRAIETYLRALADVYPSMAAFVAMEPHADRVAPHFHGLLAGLDADVPPAVDAGRHGRRPAAGASAGARNARDLLWQGWFDAHGMARLEAVTGDGASLYVAKYSMKGGDQVPWWRIWEPGELRHLYERARRTRRRRA